MKIIVSEVINQIKKAMSKCYFKDFKAFKDSSGYQWYSQMYIMSSYDTHLKEPTQVSDICEYTDKKQTEMIADTFGEISL